VTPAHETLLGFALALAIGGLIGLERERHAYAQKKPTFGGARTFPLVALFGALTGLLGQSLGPWVLVAGLITLAGLVALGYTHAQDGKGDDRLGLTSEISAIVVFLIAGLPFVELAGLAFAERLLLAGALGTIVMALLALRRPIHEFAERLSYEDMLATVRFALIAVVALPLLPNRAYDPYEVLNPFGIGVVIVLIAGISFVGYFAMRFLGARKGIGATAVAGGLVSSTAVTLTFAGKGREHGALAPAYAFAIGLAAAIMVVRVGVEIFVIRPQLLAGAWPPLAAMLAMSALGCFVLWRRMGEAPEAEDPAGVRNPFRLSQALKLGLFYAAIRFVAAAAFERFGSSGLLLSAGVAGLTDVDAITISVARMHATGLDTGIAVAAIMIAVVTNTLVKLGIVAVLGGRRLTLSVGAVLLPAAAVGGIVGMLGMLGE
jgi:uncharacterized membrane protein (DUF4010 family)